MIYIIDDDKSVRRSFEILLAANDIECKSYECAKEFLNEYLHVEGDLLLLDMHMPGISGIEVLSISKERKIDIPVIVITAYDEEESRKIAKDFGVIAYLRKPIDGEALIDLIKFNTEHTKT